jgi:hypothetical protein
MNGDRTKVAVGAGGGNGHGTTDDGQETVARE